MTFQGGDIHCFVPIPLPLFPTILLTTTTLLPPSPPPLIPLIPAIESPSSFLLAKSKPGNNSDVDIGDAGGDNTRSPSALAPALALTLTPVPGAIMTSGSGKLSSTALESCLLRLTVCSSPGCPDSCSSSPDSASSSPPCQDYRGNRQPPRVASPPGCSPPWHSPP
jgi:hypothetical protein